ncbi:hypothetical protein SSP35_02_03830 [Streptomyces sp. NBRC 110611]|uniref:methyltransferase n=1 Tax=Streptomyces sp. NBRC 110611 TaxID=1621259 RepID=UPI000855390D|nr:methyltransferase [Streptomyces sp. NBRC 110611]GAU66014.1 hypothetical protein SSP35_02_03830 [Streptomyces sp. NBRC 110611]
MPVDGYDESMALVDRTRRHGAGEFQLLGRTWELLPEVWLPTLSYSTEFYTTHLPYPPDGSFLEIGCGAGVTAVHAALSGCATVTATDVNSQAVDNTARNAERHGTSGVTAVVSDVFDGLDGHDRFDCVFWNLPYVAISTDYHYPDQLTRSVFDAGMAGCRAYVAGAARVLAPGGRLFLGLGDIGDRDAMEQAAAEHGWQVQLVAASRGEPDAHVEHRLFELVKA